MRRRAVEKINEMFDLNIEVNFREDYRQTDDENMIQNLSENETIEPKPMVVDLRTK